MIRGNLFYEAINLEKLVLPKDKLPKMINEITSHYKVYAPVGDNGITSFKQIDDHSEMDLNSLYSRVPLKSFLLKQT